MKKGCLTVIGIIILLSIVVALLPKIIGLLGLGLIGWGIYSFINNRKVGKRNIGTVVFMIVGLICIGLWNAEDTDPNLASTNGKIESSAPIDDSIDKNIETPITEQESSIDNQAVTDVIIDSEDSNEPLLAAKPTSTDDVEVADNRIPAKVIRVVDGDTVKAEIDGKEETVRMILVDTPETKHPSKPAQPFGQEASDFAVEMLENQDILLEMDVSERDRYKRILAYVWVGDKMFNEMLLEKGLARVAVFPPDVKYVDEFREIQKKAQEAEVGIWSIENYVQDNGFVVTEDKQEKTETTIEPVENEKKSESPSNGCDDPKIKGNRNSMIYHVPGGASYERTKNNVVMFCTEQEAEDAGYRKAKR